MILQDVSASIDDEDYFELMMRNAWHISGGSGWTENTTCRYVFLSGARKSRRDAADSLTACVFVAHLVGADECS